MNITDTIMCNDENIKYCTEKQNIKAYIFV